MSTVLFPDETHCRSELGALLYRDRKYYVFSADFLSVNEPTSFFGHVEYDICINAEPLDSTKYRPRRFHLTTRFRELNRLYQQLQLIHKQLYLKNTFPSFAEPKLFGSNDKTTIDERKSSIRNFLNFVLANDILSKARILQAFIDSSQELNIIETPEKLTSEVSTSVPELD